MPNCRHITISLIVVLLLSGRSASAARLINVAFESDGRALLVTSYEDSGLADAATVWRYLGQKPIMVGGSPLIRASDADPLRADLRGDVTISILHAGGLIAQAKVTGLTLLRSDDSSAQWFLPRDEVERTARVAGLGPAVSRATGWPWWVAMAAFAFLCTSLWWFARRVVAGATAS